MKIKKLNDFCVINEAHRQMNFNQNGPYTPQTELELVEIVHNIFGDKLNKKGKVSQRNINAINIDLSNIKDVTNVTKNMVKRRKLFLSDFAFLYLLGMDSRDIENEVFDIELKEGHTDGNEDRKAEIIIDTALLITPFDGVDNITMELSGEYGEDLNWNYLSYDNNDFDIDDIEKFPAEESLSEWVGNIYDPYDLFDNLDDYVTGETEYFHNNHADVEDIIDAVVNWFDEHEDAKELLNYRGLLGALDEYNGLKELARTIGMSEMILSNRIEDFEEEICDALDLDNEEE